MNMPVTRQRPARRSGRLGDVLTGGTGDAAWRDCRTSRRIAPIASLESINHYTVQRVIDVAANVDGRDLGGVAADIQTAIDKLKQGAADHHAYRSSAARTR